MDTIGQRLGLYALFHTTYRLGYGLVGQQHELLNEFVGIFRHLEIGLDGLTCLVDIKVEFLTIELHRTVLESGSTQFLGEGIEFDKHLSVLTLVRMFLRSRGCWLTCTVLHTIVLQDLLHLLVCITTITADDGMGEVPLLDVCLIIEFEDDTIAEFLLVRTERADEVAKTLREHGDGAIDEVDTRSTVVSFLVDGGAFFHVVGHIGDMHAHFPKATVELADRQGIIEVLGILGVDGTGEDLTEILTTVDLLLGDGGIDLLGGLLHVLRILIGQVVLGEDGMHLGIVVTRLTQDIDHRTDDVLVFGIRPLDDLHHGLVVGLTTLELPLGDDDVVDEGRVLWNEEGPVLIDTQPTNDLVVGALDDLNDHRLLDMFITTGHVGHLHTIAVQR